MGSLRVFNLIESFNCLKLFMWGDNNFISLSLSLRHIYQMILIKNHLYMIVINTN